MSLNPTSIWTFSDTALARFSMLVLVVGVMVSMQPGSGFAQSRVEDRQTKTLELEAVNEQLSNAELRQEELKGEIAALDEDVGAINRALIEGAKRGQQLETAITTTEVKLAKLLDSQSGLRQSLNSKRALLGEVLAALQRMGTNPPPALLVRPEDALASVRSAILLGAVVPQVRDQAAVLLSELTALQDISNTVVVEKEALTRDLNALAEDETRLSLLVEEKGRLVTQSRSDLVSERNKAIKLGQEARSLKELINSLESQIASASAAARAARLADERRRAEEIARLAKARERLANGEEIDSPGTNGTLVPEAYDPSRQEPAIAFSKAKGTLLYPVSGQELYGFGDSTPYSSASSNVAMATRPNARVRSPTDGWVVYAGPFRSYGQILILNAGEGYHMVLSGLAEVNMETGQFVLAGEPVGRMGVIRFAAAIPLDLGSNKPVLTVELRKDGKSIDPAPWWAIRKNSDNQVRPKQGT
ncbi:MAG: peptidoglycan DD-metalloendopeptidase family protein [Rhizobiaceae bacterium]